MNKLQGGTADPPMIQFPLPVVAALHRALHAMAQPLTILQSWGVMAAHAERAGGDSWREWVPETAAEVERLTGIYRCIEDLVLSGSAEEEPALMALNEVVAERAAGSRREFERRGVTLAIADGIPEICLPARPWGEALRMVFAMALGSCAPGAEVRVRPCPEGLQVDTDAAVADSLAELKIDVAAALLSPAARLVWQKEPFTVEIARVT